MTTQNHTCLNRRQVLKTGPEVEKVQDQYQWAKMAQKAETDDEDK